MRFGLVGPASQVQSPLANNEQLINWYFEKTESPNAKVGGWLAPTPGIMLFSNLSAAAGTALPSVRGSWITSGRRFFVAGTHLLELTGTGVATDYGGFGGNNNIVDDGLPAIMVDAGTVGGAYPSQLLIASGGSLSVFSLVSNTFQAMTTPPTGVQSVEFLDGYFLALSTSGAGVNSFSASNAEDATTWSGLSVSQVQVFSDTLLSMKAINRLLWVFGAKRAVAYYLSGAPLFPFDVVSGGFMETGIEAQFSVARVASHQGTTICWLAGDERGGHWVAAANGFTAQRVSDYALEYWMAQQKTGVSDAIGMGRGDQGHNFYDLWFPSANATWTLDIDNGWWHRRSSLVNGVAAAHIGRTHIWDGAFHLVGDRTSGNVYQMTINAYNENVGAGVFNPIIRTRVGPTIESEGGQLTVPINEFQIDLETGLGPIPPLVDAFGNPRDPYLMVSYSEDHGKTWGSERMLACGQAGNNIVPVVDRRLGSWRSWTPKITASDPIPWRVIDGYTNGTQDSEPRYAKSIAKIS